MRELDKFYINGAWVKPTTSATMDVINPASEEPCAVVSLGAQADVDAAVAAARAAFPDFSQSTRDERIAILERILAAYQARYADIAAAISEEMGAPISLAQQAQAGSGLAQLQSTISILKEMEFEQTKGGFTLIREPIGVVGLITPWNWPINQAVCKIAPAIAAGCTMVWKPSEVAPISAYILSEAIDAADLPTGVFNMVNGTGPDVGAAISSHPDIDMVSFTGSTRAGIEVAKNAAPTVKRVAQELGGKSPNIILEGADLNAAIAHGVGAVMLNSGQSCNAPTRMIAPRGSLAEIEQIAAATADAFAPDDPSSPETRMGPVVSETQWNKIQGLIEKGIEEGAKLVTGGAGRPADHNKGYYVKPTIFSDVTNDMTIAREEIFGPVLCILPYDNVDEAVAIANDTLYGLSSYVFGQDVESACAVGKRIRAGDVHINGANVNFAAPFGGYKQSGNGREWGAAGIEEFLETKAMLGAA